MSPSKKKKKKKKERGFICCFQWIGKSQEEDAGPKVSGQVG
jgi:hypothetical protein